MKNDPIAACFILICALRSCDAKTTCAHRVNFKRQSSAKANQQKLKKESNQRNAEADIDGAQRQFNNIWAFELFELFQAWRVNWTGKHSRESSKRSSSRRTVLAELEEVGKIWEEMKSTIGSAWQMPYVSLGDKG